MIIIKGAKGNTAIIPSNRNWDIKLRGFYKEIQIKVKLENVSINSEIVIEVEGEKTHNR